MPRAVRYVHYFDPLPPTERWSEHPCPNGHTVPLARRKCNGYCVECDIERRHRRYREETGKVKLSIRNANLRRQYGLDHDDFEAILAEQGGGCAVCGAVPSEDGPTFHVDHDHDTGTVRGVLCPSCNRGFGMLGDSPERVEALLRYATKGEPE